MAAIRLLFNIIALPVRLVAGGGSDTHTSRSARTPIILHWRKGDDGKLEGRWNCD